MEQKNSKSYKIVGPGNSYVAQAMRAVFGDVGVQSIQLDHQK